MPMTQNGPNGPRIAYEVHGTSGPPVVLVMGLGMRGRVWSSQVDGLRSTHRVVTFDNRGIGDSEDADGYWTVRDMAADVLRVMDAAGFSSAHVVGVSMGGMISQELALAAPLRLRSLSLIATHAGGPLGVLPPARGLALFLAVNLLPRRERARALCQLLYPPDFLRVVDRAALDGRMAEQLGSRPSATTRKKQLAAVARHDTRARLASLGVPTLVLCAARDALVDPAQQRLLAAGLTAPTVVTFDQAGHGVIFQCAGAVNGHLARHFAAHEPAPADAADPAIDPVPPVISR